MRSPKAFQIRPWRVVRKSLQADTFLVALLVQRQIHGCGPLVRGYHVNQHVEVFRQPTPDGYPQVLQPTNIERLSPVLLPDILVLIAELWVKKETL